MPFNPEALTERTLKQFVDRLHKQMKDYKLNEDQSNWPLKRSACQEMVAKMLGCNNWHHIKKLVEENTVAQEPEVAQEPKDATYTDISNIQNSATPGSLQEYFGCYGSEPAFWSIEDFYELLTWVFEKATDLVIDTEKDQRILV